MALTSATRGAGKTELVGLAELSTTLSSLIEAVDPRQFSSGRRAAIIAKAKKDLNVALSQSAQYIRDDARAAAARKRWPRAVVEKAFFKYSGPDKSAGARQARISSLAGIRPGIRTRERGLYFSWVARLSTRLEFAGRRIVGGKTYDPARLSRGGAKILSMGFARLFEFGSKGITAFTRKRWPVNKVFGPAVERNRAKIVARISAGFKAVIAEIVDKTAYREK